MQLLVQTRRCHGMVRGRVSRLVSNKWWQSRGRRRGGPDKGSSGWGLGTATAIRAIEQSAAIGDSRRNSQCAVLAAVSGPAKGNRRGAPPPPGR